MRRIYLVSLMFLACNPSTEAPPKAPEAAVDRVETLIQEVNGGGAPAVAAAAALGQMGKDAVRAVGALGAALNRPETRVQLAALNALNQLAQAGVAMDGLAQALVALLNNKVAPIRAGAAQLLGHLGGAADSVPALAARLGDEAAEVRVAASRSLSRLGEAARPALAALVGQVNDADVAVRLWTRQAVTALDPNNAASLRPVLAMMADERLPEALRQQAEEILKSWIGGGPAEVAPVLRAVLEDALPGSEGAVREVAIRGVRLLSGELGSLPRMLLDAARNPDDPLRILAIQALGALGRRAQAVVLELPGLLKDADEGVRAAAAFAVGGLADAGRAALPLLEQALDDPAAAVRAAALRALGSVVGPEEAERLLPRLIEMLKDGSALVRAGAADALGRMGGLLSDASAAIKPLVAALADNTEEVALAALASLKSMGSKAKDALPDILDAVAKGSARLKTAAVDAAVTLGDGAGDMTRRVLGRNEALDAALKQAMEAAEAPPSEAP